MKFFSGFSLENESYLFEKYIKNDSYTITGFSYGAIKAFEFAKEQLDKGKRVDTLQLISPAFFQNKSEKFKRLQLISYKKNDNLYLKEFINNCFYPYDNKIIQHKKTTVFELEYLLNYVWNKDELQKIKDMGVVVEVYLGENDAIIDVDNVKKFFLCIATVSYIKDANHFLQIDK